jgi:hypothetical protein
MQDNFILLCPMNIEYILMMSFYTLRSIVAFKSENNINMAFSRKIVRDVFTLHVCSSCIIFWHKMESIDEIYLKN